MDRSGPSPRLVVNAEEAARVREIFDLYLKLGSLLPVAQEMARRGWRTKSRLTKAGKKVLGQPFNKCSLYGLLTNPLYVGKIRHKDEVYEGEQEAIVDAGVFAKVQTLLGHNGRTGGIEARNRHGALLRGLLHCKACSRTMVHTFTTKRGRLYRYYTCVRAIKSGRAACPSQSLPAAEIEKVVLDQIRCIGRDASLLADMLKEAKASIETDVAELHKERMGLRHELARHQAEVRKLVAKICIGNTTHLADLHERSRRAEQRLLEIGEKVSALEKEQISESDVRAAFADFDNVWGMLSPIEQVRLLALLIARVEYDAAAGTVSVTFHPTGIKALQQQVLEEAA